MPDLREAYEMFIQLSEARAARKPYATNLALRELGRSCLRQLEGEAPIVWTRCTFPQELIAAFGAIPVATEIVSTIIGFNKNGPDYLHITEALGFSTDSCTVQRVPLGALLGETTIVPSLLIGITDYCEDGMRFFEHLSQHRGVEYVLLEVPPECNEEAIHYVERQLVDIIHKLEEVTGRPLDIDRLRELIRYSNEVTHYKEKVNELRRAVPARFSGRRDGDFFPLLEFGVYGEVAARLAKQFYEEALATADKESPPERARLLWLYTLPPVPRLIELMEEQWGARVVATEANRIFWQELDEGQPLYSLARKICQSRTIGLIENRLGHILELAREYSVNGAIHFSHFSCAYSVGATRVIKDQLASLGIPLLNLDGDCAVTQHNDPEAMREGLERFIEMITS